MSEPSWWYGTNVYQIYPRSFSDSNNDGIGDIRGIISRLDYIKETGFETIWCSPFYPSPQKDFGYDISDYRGIAPEYGSMDDYFRLVEEIHKRDMKIILDMVLNHTSDEHPWFRESASSLGNPRRDWYVWKDGRGRRPPNNWLSQVSGSGWHYSDTTGQWYWASFLPFQPDLNYRNQEVKNEMLDTLRFWLERGADGFRLDIIGSIFEDADFRNNPASLKLFPDETHEGMLFKSTKMTHNLPESIEFTKELRRVTEEFQNPPRILVGETFGTPDDIAEFCRNRGLHAAFAFKCASEPFTAPSFRKLIQEYEDCFEYPLSPCWAFSNHDRIRRYSALGNNEKKAVLNLVFQLTVRGIPFIYNGEEIGMSNGRIPGKLSLDPVSEGFNRLPGPVFNFIDRKVGCALNRDNCRTPMQWTSEQNAGFTASGAVPWLPINSDYKTVNAEIQQKDAGSLYNCCRRFLHFRNSSTALRFGSIELLPEDSLPGGVLGYRRKYKDEECLVLLNFTGKKKKLGAGPAESFRKRISTQPEGSAPETGDISLSDYEGLVFYNQ